MIIFERIIRLIRNRKRKCKCKCKLIIMYEHFEEKLAPCVRMSVYIYCSSTIVNLQIVLILLLSLLLFRSMSLTSFGSCFKIVCLNQLNF